MRAIRVTRAALTMAFLLAALSRLVLAAPTEADKATARGLMVQADAHFEAKQYAEALRLYKAAHNLMGVPTTGVGEARAEAALGQLIEARATAIAVTRIPEQPGEPKVFAEARAAAQALVDDLDRRIPALLVKLPNLPTSASVSLAVDGEAVLVPQGRAPLPRNVNPGAHRIVVTAPGYEQSTREVQVPEGKTTEVVIELQPEAPPISIGPTALFAEQPRPLTPSAPEPREPQESSASRTQRKAGWIGLGVGAAGVAVGAGTGITALIMRSVLHGDGCGGNVCPDKKYQGRVDTYNALLTVSTVGFIVGGVGAAAGATLLLTSPKRESQPSAALYIGPGSVAVSGGF
jgi:hypothetical protein